VRRPSFLLIRKVGSGSDGRREGRGSCFGSLRRRPPLDSQLGNSPSRSPSSHALSGAVKRSCAVLVGSPRYQMTRQRAAVSVPPLTVGSTNCPLWTRGHAPLCFLSEPSSSSRRRHPLRCSGLGCHHRAIAAAAAVFLSWLSLSLSSSSPFVIPASQALTCPRTYPCRPRCW
jgi:hypothetical protein